VLEDCRGRGELGASLEAQVQLDTEGLEEGEGTTTAAPLGEALALLAASPHPDVDNLADWLLVSALRIGGPPLREPLAEATAEGVRVRVARAEGTKCERCWHHETDVGQHAAHPTLCGRCVTVLDG
jgi:isoleucyl-tRNA synthetase